MLAQPVTASRIGAVWIGLAWFCALMVVHRWVAAGTAPVDAERCLDSEKGGSSAGRLLAGNAPNGFVRPRYAENIAPPGNSQTALHAL